MQTVKIAETFTNDWEKLRHTELPTEDTLQSVEQPADSTCRLSSEPQVSRFVSHADAGVGFGDAAVFESLLLL